MATKATNPDNSESGLYLDHDVSPEDHEFDGLTLYEKKALLVNRELDSQGMGRYQWYIFTLCGFGYFLDLLWAQAFGLVLAPIQQEFGFPAADLGNLSTCFSAGLTAGAFIWGFLVDIIGRYWAFNFTVLWSSIFGLVLGAPNTYTGVLVITAFIGIGIGGNIPIDTTICLECLPQNRRWLLPALSVFQPLGVIVCSGIAYGYIPNYSCAADLESCNNVAAGQPCCSKSDNYGWRYLMYTLGCITIVFFFLRFFAFRFQESPKYLLYRGRDAEAVKSLDYMARFNGKQNRITVEALSNFDKVNPDRNSNQSLASDRPMIVGGAPAVPVNPTIRQQFQGEIARYKILFSDRDMVRLIILLWIIYGFDYWGFTVAGAFLPYIIAQKGAALGLSLRETYRSYIYIFIFGLPGVMLGATIYKWRRLSMLFSSALFGACLFVFTAVNSEASYIGVNGLVYFFQSMFNAILYGMTPEFFPAPVRGTACGVASFWGRIFSIIAPIAGSRVLAKSLDGVLYMAGAGVFVCTIAICFLPKKFMGSQSF